MVNKISVLFLLFVFAKFAVAQNDEKLIVKTFEHYKSAIMNGRGEEAVKFVDSRTIRYYSYIVEMVKHADSLKVCSLQLIDRIMVFSIRHRATKNEILSFNGKSLLAYSIKEGMIIKNSVSNVNIGEITISGDMAKGRFLINGKEAPLYFSFYKEEGAWKLNLISQFSNSDASLKKLIRSSGQTENEYIFSLLYKLSNRKPRPEIWKTIQ